MKNDRYFYHGVVFFALLFLASSAGFAQARENAIAARSATVDGVKLHYLNAGHGPTVILLHGYTQTSRMWTPIIPSWPGNLRLLRLTCPVSVTRRFRRAGWT